MQHATCTNETLTHTAHNTSPCGATYTHDASHHCARPPPQHFRGQGAEELASFPAPPQRAKKAPAPETQAFLMFLHDVANKARWDAAGVAKKAQAAAAEWKEMDAAQKQVYKEMAKETMQRSAAAAGECTWGKLGSQTGGG